MEADDTRAVPERSDTARLDLILSWKPWLTRRMLDVQLEIQEIRKRIPPPQK